MNGEYLTRDLSGNNNHGLSQYIRPVNGPGNTEKAALRLKNTLKSFIHISNSGPLDVRYSMTVSMLLRIWSSSKGPVFVWEPFYSNATYGMGLWLRGNGRLMFRTRLRDGFTANSKIAHIKSETMTYIAATYDSTTGTAVIYVDDKLVIKESYRTGEMDTGGRIAIGNQGGLPFDGVISCVQLYDGVLAQDEIFNVTSRNCKPPGKIDIWLWLYIIITYANLIFFTSEIIFGFSCEFISFYTNINSWVCIVQSRGISL